MSLQQTEQHTLEIKEKDTIVPEPISQNSNDENEEAEQINPLGDEPRMSIERPYENEKDKNEANPMALRHAKTPNYLENRKLQEIQDENSRSIEAEIDLNNTESKPKDDVIVVEKEKVVEIVNQELTLTTDQSGQMTILNTETRQDAQTEAITLVNHETNNDKAEDPQQLISESTKTDSTKSDDQTENVAQESSNGENEEKLSVKSQPENTTAVIEEDKPTRKSVVIKKPNMSNSKVVQSGKKSTYADQHSAKKSAGGSAAKSTVSIMNTSTKKRKFDAIQIENIPQTPTDVSQELKKTKKNDNGTPLTAGKNGSTAKQIQIKVAQNNKTPEVKQSNFLKKSSGLKSAGSKQMKENIPNENVDDTKKNECNSNAMKLSGLKPVRCCAYCGGDFESKSQYMTLTCLHRAHRECFTSMEKKKKGQCPLCNSTNSFAKPTPAFEGAQKINIKF